MIAGTYAATVHSARDGLDGAVASLIEDGSVAVHQGCVVHYLGSLLTGFGVLLLVPLTLATSVRAPGTGGQTEGTRRESILSQAPGSQCLELTQVLGILRAAGGLLHGDDVIQ